MESDTDSECELPPGWEKCTNNNQTVFINHINKTSQLVSPMRFLHMDNDYSTKGFHYNKSCGFGRSRRKLDKFVQKYDSFSTAEQVMINSKLASKHAIVIGGCSGIGLEMVHHLISKNCTVILGCPNVGKCSSDLIMKIGQECLMEFITIFHLDLTSFQSIKTFCDLVLKTTSSAEMIILSAGVMSPPYIITPDGFESSFQINVLSQFYIQETLLSKFTQSPNQCRVVWLACESHRAINNFQTSQLHPSSIDYNGFHAYALSNLCKIILVGQSKKKWDGFSCNGKPLFFACHPGNVVNGTKITRYKPLVKCMFWLLSPFTKTLSQASATPLLCCVSSSMKPFSGSYFNNACICQPSELASNETNGKILWQYVNDIISQTKANLENQRNKYRNMC